MNCRINGRKKGGFTSRLECCCGGVTEREGWDESSCWLSEGPADISRWWLKKKELWEIDIIGVRARSHERGEWESKQSVGKTSVAHLQQVIRGNSIVIRGNLRVSASRQPLSPTLSLPTLCLCTAHSECSSTVSSRPYAGSMHP